MAARDGMASRERGIDALVAWAPAVAWAALIFYASTDAFSSQNTGRLLASILQWLVPSISREQADLVNVIVRKGAHFTEYFILYPLVYRGVAARRRAWRGSHAFVAWLIVVAYAILDEFHQSFVATRTASPWDSLLDIAGGSVGMLAMFVVSRWRAAVTRHSYPESERR